MRFVLLVLNKYVSSIFIHELKEKKKNLFIGLILIFFDISFNLPKLIDPWLNSPQGGAAYP